MSRCSGPMVIVCAALVIASCRGKGEAEEPAPASGAVIENRVAEPEPAPEPEPEEPAPGAEAEEPEVAVDATAPATQPSQGPLAAQVSINQLMTGVPECDQFMREFVGCAATLPEATQRPMMKSVLQVKDAWQKAAGTAQGRKAMAQSCQQALVAARQSYRSMGCFATP